MDLKKGFTLIELLTVIAIISLLAAILFPVFAQAREKARQTTCESNLHQIGLAFQQYITDYDEDYPCDSTDPYLWEGEHFRWPIMPYLGIGQKQGAADGSIGGAGTAMILHCPSDTNSSFDATSYGYSAAFYLSPVEVSNIHSISCLYQSAYSCGLMPTAQSDAELQTPAQKILCGEWADNHDGKLAAADGWWTNRNVWHEFCFADGHVAYIPTGKQTKGEDGFPDPNATPGGLGGSDLQ